MSSNSNEIDQTVIPAPSTENFDLDLIFGTFPTPRGLEFSGVGEQSEKLDKAHPLDPLFGLMDATMVPYGDFSNSDLNLGYDPLA